MEKLEAILNRIRSTVHSAALPTLSNEQPQYQCSKCQDRELIDRGDGIYTFCECRKQKILQRRIKSSQIAPSFMKATLDNFQSAPHTEKMLQMARTYTEQYDTIKNLSNNSMGFLARLGESTIKEIKDPQQRQRVKQKHNSYGLGKTHLLTATALALLKKGIQVLLVNDADMVAELRHGQFAETGEGFETLIGSLERAELLIWDDLGKAKTTEWVLNQYYRIINYRYRMGLPTCFSSNEDLETLPERIGDATASRLYAMCRGRLLLCEGPDYRVAH